MLSDTYLHTNKAGHASNLHFIGISKIGFRCESKEIGLCLKSFFRIYKKIPYGICDIKHKTRL